MNIAALASAGPASLAVLLPASDKTTTAVLADGETVTTVRDRQSQIVAITTTPPTSPANASAGIDLSA